MTEHSGIGASQYLEALQGAGVTHFVTVPDFVQLALHQAIERGDSPMALVRTCNEDQAVCAAAGLRIGGKQPIVALQNQGLYACINTVRAVALDARIPTVFLIGQFGRENANIGRPTTQSSRRVVSLLEPLLDTLQVPYWRLNTPDDLSSLGMAFESATVRRGAAALIVNQAIAWH
ncbi:MAG: thiamine pyrophosphate-binding protein [Proteobacteria bacterium]|nr:thiamine pyrophosphate-binding protein [Pseudomonadota bacterium]